MANTFGAIQMLYSLIVLKKVGYSAQEKLRLLLTGMTILERSLMRSASHKNRRVSVHRLWNIYNLFVLFNYDFSP